jgi:hypothetical protein
MKAYKIPSNFRRLLFVRLIGSHSVGCMLIFVSFFSKCPSSNAQTAPAGLSSFKLEETISGNVVRTGTMNPDVGLRNVVLAPSTVYRLSCVSASTLKFGVKSFVTPASGQRFRIPKVKCYLTGADTDGDGLCDEAEAIVGTAPDNRDTDGDGVLDGAEVRAGTNPADGLGSQIGIVASAPIGGTTLDIAAANGIAIVAHGSSGFTLFNVLAGLNPGRLVQQDTQGFAQAVALSGSYALIADRQGGAVILDLRDQEILLDPALRSAALVPVSVGGQATAVATDGVTGFVGTSSGQIVVLDLASRREVSRLTLPSGSTVEDLQIEGEKLYALQTNTLRVLSITGPTLAVQGSLGLSLQRSNMQVRFRLFVGNGLAYATHSRGYHLVDVTTPTTPSLVRSHSDNQFGWKQMIQNGSGLGLACASPNSTPDGPHHLSVYSVGANGRSTVFLNTIETPGIATEVSVYNGMAYVADGAAGLQVVNYRASDTLRVPPTIQLASNFNLAGGAAEEGKRMRLTATVTDDVQARNVEFYVDGQLSATDGNFPFEHAFLTPVRTPEKQTFTVRAKATDTGGNFAWSTEYTLTLFDDIVPPNVIQATPQGSVESTSELLLFFNEALASASVPGSISLVSAGTDRVFGTADDAPVAGLRFSHRTEIDAIQLEFTSPLAGGLYQATVSTQITDMAGNHLASAYKWQFMTGITNQWIAANGGQWSNPLNWSSGVVPDHLDRVLVELPPGQTLIIPSGSWSVQGITVRGRLQLNGLLNVGAELKVAGELQLGNGTVQNARIGPEGDQGFVIASGSVGTFENVTLERTLTIAPNAALEVRGNTTILGELFVEGQLRMSSAAVVGGKIIVAPIGAFMIAGATASTIQDTKVEGTLQISAGAGLRVLGTFEHTGTLQVNGALTFANAVIKGSRLIATNPALLSLGQSTAGTLDNCTLASDFFVSSGASLTLRTGLVLENASKVTLAPQNGAIPGGLLVCAGTMGIQGRGKVMCSTSGNRIAVNPVTTADGPVEVTVGPSIEVLGVVSLRATRAGDGIINFGAFTTTGFSSEAAFDNRGHLQVTGGSLSLEATWKNTEGSITVNSPYSAILGGAFTTLDLDNFTKNPECPVSISGTMDNAGTVFTHDGRLSPLGFSGTIKGGIVASTPGNEIRSGYGTFFGCSFRDLTVDGFCLFHAGLSIEAGCIFRITGNNYDGYDYPTLFFDTTQTLNGPGKMVIEKTGYVQVMIYDDDWINTVENDQVTLTLGSNFTLEFSNASTVWFEPGTVGHEVIRNQGTISMNSDLYGLMGFDSFGGYLKLQNEGLIRARKGVLFLNGSWSNAEGVVSAGAGDIVLGGKFKGTDIGQIGVPTDYIDAAYMIGEIDNRDNELTMPPPTFFSAASNGGRWMIADSHDYFDLNIPFDHKPMIIGGKIKSAPGKPLHVTAKSLILDGITIAELLEVYSEFGTFLISNGLYFDDNATLKLLPPWNLNLIFNGGAQAISGNGHIHFGSLTGPKKTFRIESRGTGTAAGAATTTIGPGMTVHAYEDGVFRSSGPHDRLINQGTLRVIGQGTHKPTVTLQNVTNQGVLQEVDGGKFLIIND